jgi:uncharacterized surface protein with fasciclin (FAS1) repeats
MLDVVRPLDVTGDPVNRPRFPRAALVAAGSFLAVTLTACGSDDTGDADASDEPTTSSSAAEESPAEPASDEPFGAGCAGIPPQGEGSIEGMSDDPVATAAANNPALSTLAQAIEAADLVDSLNSQEAITVLAPTTPAFTAVPSETLEALLDDTPQLTALLTHHALEGRLAPDELAGEQTTLNGDTVTVEGSGEDFRVPAEGTLLGEAPATVVCGNVQTANATVYIIDQVLAPPDA